MIEFLNLPRILKGLGVAVATFVSLGTVAALWENPIFVRMTPAGEFEIVLLGALSVLLGVYAAIRRPFCSIKAAGAGGVLGFLGVACPICNKILLLLFGGELLMTYYEPARIYLAAAGVLVAAVIVVHEWTLVRRQSAEAMAGAA
jgi:hypothetical protein